MARPVTLFTGQWADLPLETLAQKASEWGFDGLELACWDDDFEFDQALSDDSYVQRRGELLAKYDLEVFGYKVLAPTPPSCATATTGG